MTARETGEKKVLLAGSKIRENVELPGHSGKRMIRILIHPYIFVTSLEVGSKLKAVFHMVNFGTAVQLELLRQLSSRRKGNFAL